MALNRHNPTLSLCYTYQNFFLKTNKTNTWSTQTTLLLGCKVQWTRPLHLEEPHCWLWVRIHHVALIMKAINKNSIGYIRNDIHDYYTPAGWRSNMQRYKKNPAGVSWVLFCLQDGADRFAKRCCRIESPQGWWEWSEILSAQVGAGC